MSIRQLTYLGNPILRQGAAAVSDVHASDMQTLIADMIETMQAEHGVGLAAPQIDVGQRVIVFRVPEGRGSTEILEPQALINPEITVLSEEIELGWEGCLSVPKLRGIVPRHAHIGYRGLDAEGRLIEREVRGFHARVVQHEVDHLDGIMYLDRMKDVSTLVMESELFRFLPPRPPAPEESSP